MSFKIFKEDNDMGEMTKKPLLGVKPAKLVVNDRNMDLANAIWNRTMQDTVSAADYRLMALWASEITLNCNMMLALDKVTKTL